MSCKTRAFFYRHKREKLWSVYLTGNFLRLASKTPRMNSASEWTQCRAPNHLNLRKKTCVLHLPRSICHSFFAFLRCKFFPFHQTRYKCSMLGLSSSFILQVNAAMDIGRLGGLVSKLLSTRRNPEKSVLNIAVWIETPLALLNLGFDISESYL